MAQDVDRAMERRGDVLDVYTEPGRGSKRAAELNWPGGVKMSNERGPFGGGMGKPVFGRGAQSMLIVRVERNFRYSDLSPPCPLRDFLMMLNPEAPKALSASTAAPEQGIGRRNASWSSRPRSAGVLVDSRYRQRRSAANIGKCADLLPPVPYCPPSVPTAQI